MFSREFSRDRYGVSVNPRFQKIAIVLVAVLLIVPVGVVGMQQLFPKQEASAPADPDDTRPAVDPDSQPQKPQLDKPAAPDAMTKQSGEGAEATVRYLLDAYPYMMSSGDTSVWEPHIDPNCQVCVTFVSNAKALDKQGGYLVDGQFETGKGGFEGKGDPPASGEVELAFTEAEGTLVDDPSRPASTLPPVEGTLTAKVAWDGEAWRVGDMSLEVDDEAAGAGAGAGG